MKMEQAAVMTEEPTEAENRIAKAVLDAAYAVHNALGPGLLEAVYEVCLAHKLQKPGYRVRRQVALPVIDDGVRVDAGLRIDILVNDSVIVEVKAVEEIHPVHKSQVFTYLKLTGRRLGLLINFNVRLLRDGVRRIACGKTSPGAQSPLPNN